MNEYIIAKYIRLSMDDNFSESNSIPNQRLLLDRYIDALNIPNATVLEFVDNGYSGLNLERPAVRELLDLVQCGRVNCIIMKDFSRFSRCAIESGYYIEQVFPLYRIRFISASDNFDSDEHKGGTAGMEVAFKFLMHEHYSQDLSRKIKSALRVRMTRGEYVVANATYGYHKNRLGQWEIDREAADIVRQIYKMALDALPTAMIRDRLCAARYPTPREYAKLKRGKDIVPSCVWSARSVMNILQNEQYTGMYVSGKNEQKAVGSKSRNSVDKSGWIRIPDRHPAIVSTEDFAAVQAILARLKHSTSVKPTNMLHDEGRSVRTRMVNGEHLSAKPIFGYSKATQGGLELDASAAKVVRKVFDMTLQGLSFAEIADKLSAARCPTPGEYTQLSRGYDITPDCQWTTRKVRDILQNVQYTGAYVSGTELFDTITGKTVHIPKCDWVVIPGKYPALISDDIFAQAQEITANRREKRRKKDYLLRGIIRCGCCGHAMVYDDTLKDSVYRCWHSLADVGAECHRMVVGVSELDGAVLDIIQKQAEIVIGTFDLADFHKASVDDKRIAECEKQIGECVARRQKCYERFVHGEIERGEFLEEKAGYAERIERLSEQISALKQARVFRESRAKVASVAQEVLSETATRRRIVDALVEKVFVSQGNDVRIEWKVVGFGVRADAMTQRPSF